MGHFCPPGYPQHCFLGRPGGWGRCNLFGSPPGKEAELRQVGVQAVDVHVEDVQVGVTAVVDEVAQVPVVRRVHLQANKDVTVFQLNIGV